MSICSVCGAEFEQKTGRGRRLQRCPDHRRVRNRSSRGELREIAPPNSPRAELYRDDARKHAVEVLGEEGAREKADMIEQYAIACQLARGIYDDWNADGRPAFYRSGDKILEHPLVGAIIKAQGAVVKLSEQIVMTAPVKNHVGRRRGSVSAPDRAAAAGRPRLLVLK